MSRVVDCCVLALLLGVSSPAVAENADPPKETAEPEPEVLIEKTTHGGWGGPVVQISTVRDRTAVFVGGRGGWLIDRRFTIGAGAFGLTNGILAPDAVQVPGQEVELKMGYGGAWLEYVLSPSRLVHVSLGTLVGGGGLSLAVRDGGDLGSGSDDFFVVEPAVIAELNLAKHVRANVGAAYRWMSGVDMDGLSTSDVAGFSVIVALKFGKF